MSARARVLLTLVSGGLIGLIVLPMFPTAARAAVGTVLRTVDIQAPALCDELFFSPALNQNTPKSLAVATVQGSKVGHPEHPVLLVTACVSTFANFPAKASSLYFLNPATGAVVKTITTKQAGANFAPPLGWGAVTYRPDKGDLLGCGNPGPESLTPGRPHPIYRINISVFDSVPDGTVTFLFNGQGGTDLCDGLTWDPSDDTIYQSKDVSSTISHFTESGAAPPAPALSILNAPADCPNSGLALVGGTLFLGCDGVLKVYQLNKNDGTVIRSFETPANTRTEDLECDPITFAGSGVDAIWSKDAFPVDPVTGAPDADPSPDPDGVNNVQRLFAFEVPAGTCGLPTGPTVLNPAACLTVVGGVLRQDPANRTDTDGDGLLDCWEDGTVWASLGAACPLCPTDGLPGIDFNGDGARDIVLCVDVNANGVFDAGECADKNQKDLFVEFDAMPPHTANLVALNNVITAFFNAPVGNPGPGGLGPTGIRLHIQIDDQNVPHADNTALPPCTPPPAGSDADFDTLKATWFGTAAERALAEPQRSNTLFAKRMAFRYGLSVHNLTRPAGTTSPSGCAEVPGNDFIISLGSFGSGTHRVGTQDHWEGTFMHEFGHTLGLRHGGGDNINCKPNYLSVMSYTRQFKNVITDRPLDYSDRVLLTLDEAFLSEAAGIGGALLPAGTRTAYAATPTGGTAGSAIVVDATVAISWDGDRKTNEQVANFDINRISSGTGCTGDGSPTPLVGFDDWGNLQYNFRASFDFADGVHATTEETANTEEVSNPEITPAQEEALFEARDEDGNGIGDAVEGCGGPCVIDLDPDDPSNTVFVFNGTVVVPVVIFSSAVFAATDVDPTTLTLNDTPVAVKRGNQPRCTTPDVNNDGLRDLLCDFRLTGLSPGDEIAVLKGTTFPPASMPIRGHDTMHLVPAP